MSKPTSEPEEFFENPIFHAYQKAIRAAEIAYGGCHHCYGKGYATVIETSSWSDTDQDIGSIGGSGSASTSSIRFCSCDRGKQLKAVIVGTEVALLESIVYYRDESQRSPHDAGREALSKLAEINQREEK